MDFPETGTSGALRVFAERVIRGDFCRYLEVCDDGTVHTSKDLTAHRKDGGDWWDRHLNPITDQDSGRVATYLVRPRRQDPPTSPLVWVLDLAGTSSRRTSTTTESSTSTTWGADEQGSCFPPVTACSTP
jgi:hypothetical protein